MARDNCVYMRFSCSANGTEKLPAIFLDVAVEGGFGIWKVSSLLQQYNRLFQPAIALGSLFQCFFGGELHVILALSDDGLR